MMAVLLCCGISAHGEAVYQWSVPLEGVSETDNPQPGYPRAFLWIPPDCKQVRGVVVGMNNMEEEPILEDANFRKTLADLGFAEIWITRMMGSIHFRYDLGQDVVFTKMLKDLAAESGYQELEFVPWVPMGHSATASWGWDIAAWKPERTLAVLSISGQWPYYKDSATMGNNGSPDWGQRTVDGVPGLTTKGEYEIQGNTDGWYYHLRGDQFKVHPKTVFTQVVEPGGGHFDATSEKIALISLYLRKAAQYRLPQDTAMPTSPVTLTPIDPTTTGWLFEGWHLNREPAAEAAPVTDYKGDRNDAYWAFDEEMAKAIENFQSKFRNQRAVLVGFKQKDGLTRPTPDHGMVHLKFEPAADGVTFKLSGGFWDTVPATKDGKGAEWQGWLGEGKTVNQGDTISHPENSEGRIMITRIDGPVRQTGPDTFVLQPYRIGTLDARRSNDIWLAATWPGDGTYKGMVQQAELRFPLTNHEGASQTITFPEIPDQVAGVKSVKLAATSSANVPVSYYVREGPAEVAPDGTLTFTPVPPRSKFPIAVTVVATQWGRAIDPKLQTAQPVERTFAITAAPVAGAH